MGHLDPFAGVGGSDDFGVAASRCQNRLAFSILVERRFPVAQMVTW